MYVINSPSALEYTCSTGHLFFSSLVAYIVICYLINANWIKRVFWSDKNTGIHHLQIVWALLNWISLLFFRVIVCINFL